MNIQPFHNADEDDAVLADLGRLVEPADQLTIGLLWEQDRDFASENQVLRVLGVLDDRIGASGAYWHSILAAEKPYQFTHP